MLFIDADDVLAINTIEKSLLLAKKYNADMVQFDFAFLKNGDGIDEFSSSKEHYEASMNTEAALRLLLDRNSNRGKDDRFTNLRFASGCVWGKLMRREVVFDVQYPENRRYEDTAVVHYYFLNSRTIVVSNDILYFYRINQAGFLQTVTWKNKLDKVFALRERIEVLRLRKMPDSLVQYALSDYYGCVLHTYIEMRDSKGFLTDKDDNYLYTAKTDWKKNNKLPKKEWIKFSLFFALPALYYRAYRLVKH